MRLDQVRAPVADQRPQGPDGTEVHAQARHRPAVGAEHADRGVERHRRRAGTEHRHRLLDPEPVEGRDEVGGEHLGASSLPGGDHVQYPHYPSPCRRLALYAELTGPVSTPSPY